MKKIYDVIIIGAGIVGVSTGRFLQQKGLSVAILDKKGVAEETSLGNSGLIDSGYALPFAPPPLNKIPSILIGKESSARLGWPSGLKSIPWIAGYYLNSLPKKRRELGAAVNPLIQNAVNTHKELLKNTDGLKYLKETGRAKLYRTQKSFEAAKEEIRILEQYGITCNVFDAEEFVEIEPDVTPSFFKAVTCENSARYINPNKAITAMANYFSGQGGDIIIEKAHTLKQDKGIWNINNKYRGNHIIVCTGPWANNILKPLGHKFPIAMKRGYHQHVKTTANLNHALVDVENGYLICPMEESIRLTTGVEFASRDAPPNPKQLDQIIVKAKKIIDIGDYLDTKPWLGSRPCLADSLPVIGPSSKHKNLWFNFGHGHIGLTIGPGTGKLLSQMMLNEKMNFESAAFSPQRFGQ